MEKGKYWLSGFLLLVVLTASVYFVLDDNLRIDIGKTRSIFSVYEDGEWVISGVEYVNLFDGTAKMRAKNRSLDTVIGEDNITTVTRIANYKDGISTIEIYTFNPNVEEVELFPISHSIQVINGEGKLLQHEVQKLLYSGETVWDIQSPQSFGHKMKVEWESGNYYSRIWKYSGKDEGKLTVKYRIDSDDYNTNVRLFDPEEVGFWYNGELITSLNLELGTNVTISANLTGATTVCVDIDHPDYGDEYACGSPNANFTFNISYFRETEFNDSETEKNINPSLVMNSTGDYGLSWGSFPTYEYCANLTFGNSGIPKIQFYVYSYDYWNEPAIIRIRDENKNLLEEITDTDRDKIVYSVKNYQADVYYGVCLRHDGTTEPWGDGRTYDYIEASRGGINYAIEGHVLPADDYSPRYDIVSSSDLIYIKSHQYDKVQNLSINVTGIETAKNVKIYINDTQTNYYPYIYNTTSATITETEETEFNLVNGNSTTFSIPKSSVVTNTTMNFTGGNITWEISEYIIPVNAYGVLGSPAIGRAYWRCYTLTYGHIECLSPYTAYDGITITSAYPYLSPLYDSDYDAYIYENYTIDSNNLMATWSSTYQAASPVTFYQYCWDGSSWDNIITNSTSSFWSPLVVNLPAPCLAQSKLQIKTKLVYAPSGGIVHTTSYHEGKVNYYRYGYPENLTIEVGIVDGIQEYQGYGELTGSNSTTTFVDAINTFLVTCTADDNGYCEVPIYFNSQDGGSLTLDNFSVTYISDPNPIIISSSVISDYLENSPIGYVDIPITISMESGSLNVSDLRYDYAGGNDTIEVFAYEQGDESNNETLSLINYFTDWDYSLPRFIDWLEFIPRFWNSKNVTPYGQTDTTPILNISFYNYGNKNANLSIYLNETDSCVNLTIGINSTKSSGTQLSNGTWTDLLTDREYLNSSGLWMWADYGFTGAQLNWSWWFPNTYIRACCVDCICSEDLI